MTKENKKNMQGTKYIVLATALYLLLTLGVSALRAEDDEQDNSQNQVQICQDSLTSLVDTNYNLNYDKNLLEETLNVGNHRFPSIVENLKDFQYKDIIDIDSRKKKVMKVMPESEPYLNIVYEKSLRKGIAPEEFCAIIENESDWNPRATSYMGCKGLSQMNPKYHKLANYYDSDENLDAGTSYYSFLRNKFETREEAIAAYHTGQNRVARWLKSGKWDGKSIDKIPSKRTKRYVKNVLSTLDKINCGG